MDQRRRRRWLGQITHARPRHYPVYYKSTLIRSAAPQHCDCSRAPAGPPLQCPRGPSYRLTAPGAAPQPARRYGSDAGEKQPILRRLCCSAISDWYENLNNSYWLPDCELACLNWPCVKTLAVSIYHSVAPFFAVSGRGGDNARLNVERMIVLSNKIHHMVALGQALKST